MLQTPVQTSFLCLNARRSAHSQQNRVQELPAALTATSRALHHPACSRKWMLLLPIYAVFFCSSVESCLTWLNHAFFFFLSYFFFILATVDSSGKAEVSQFFILFCHVLLEVSLLDIDWVLCRKILTLSMLHYLQLNLQISLLLSTDNFCLETCLRKSLNYKHKWGLDLLGNGPSHVSGLVFFTVMTMMSFI